MKKLLYPSLILSLNFVQAQEFIDPDFFLLKQEMQPKVLLIGSWHFNYPGLDSYKRN